MKRIRALAVACLLTVLPAGQAAASPPPELRGLVAATVPVGCTEYSILFWDLYRAELWSDASALPGREFGLSLTYLSDFTRGELTESSVDEMSRMSGRPESSFAAARSEMDAAFRDVAEGDRITAWRQDGRV